MLSSEQEHARAQSSSFETAPPAGREQLRALMQFHLDCGCDELLSPTPVHRFLASPAKPPAAGARAQSVKDKTASTNKNNVAVGVAAPQAAPQVAPLEERIARAQALANAATSLDALRRALDDYDELPIKTQAYNTVFADGERDAPLMLVGEAPGRDEDLQGKPFVGASGVLLDKMLAACGWERASHVYIANCLPWRPPGNRNPTPEELQLMAPFVHRHIFLKRPRLLVLLGGVATGLLLPALGTIGRARGAWHDYAHGGLVIPTRPMFHPAWFLRRPEQKNLGWQDWLAVRQRLESL